jgi:catechol 2,3-dioxygenase-like lactoylglutathione lyase family enzyme
MYLEQVAIIVDDYDVAIEFFVEKLGFELVEDLPALTNDGRPKTWVVVRPPNATTALLLAQADGEVQERAVGQQFAGRVGAFSPRRPFSDRVWAHAPERCGVRQRAP